MLSMLSLTQESKITAPDKAFAAMKVIIDIVKDKRLSGSLKESLIQPTISLTNETTASNKLKMQGLMLLRDLAWDLSISPSSKYRISSAYQTVTLDLDSAELYNGLKLDTMVGVFLDNNIDPAIKEQSVDPILSIVSNTELPTTTIQHAIEALGSIAQDPYVSASAKEKMVVPVENLITNNLISMKSNSTWYNILKYSLGILTIILDDKAISGNTKNNIKNWISNLDIFNDHSLSIWKEFQIVVIGHYYDYFDASIVPALYNVLDALPVDMRPRLISVENLNNPSLMGSYTISNAAINLGYGRKSVKAYESAILYEIGHYLYYSNKINETLKNKEQVLWKQSTSFLDYSRPNSRVMASDDFASTFENYMMDTETLIIRAKFLAQSSSIKDDTLLSKALLIAQIFSHQDPMVSREGTYAYIYFIDSKGVITRKKVAMTQQTINGNTYYIPNMLKIISQVSYSTRI